MGAADVIARLEHVTVYASGARVRRVTTVAAPLPPRVRIVDLPLAVIDDTVRVSVGGPAIAVALRVGVDAPAPEAALPEDSAELRAATRRARLAASEVERIAAALAAASTSAIADDPSDEAPAPWAEIVAARRAIITQRAQRELLLREQHAAAKHAADEAARALAVVTERERRGSNARPAKLHELRKFVDIELAATANDDLVIHLEYQVAAARWAPSYVARIDSDGVRFEVRASVAQATGEDWTAVPLVLSTAEPERFALLPELHPQRIGRRQAPVPRAGFRAPPQGAIALYADYQRDRGSDDVEPAPEPLISAEVWDEDSSRAKERFTPPPSAAMPIQPAPLASFSGPAPKLADMARGGAAPGGMAPQSRSLKKLAGVPAEVSAEPVPRLDYGALVMAPPTSPSRGTLIAAPADPYAGTVASETEKARARIAILPLPVGCVVSWSHAYDYAFATDGAVDVAADGAWHSIAVTAKPTTTKLRHVAVPREQADVFRVAHIANPLAGPLLPGPIDVYDRGRFLVTSSVEYTPPGATVAIGLGVDPQVKIARNTEFREEAAGMLRGALRLHHAIAITVENLSPRTLELEVRERLPVTRDGDDDVELVLGRSEPAWERWTPDPEAPRAQRLRGGYRWMLSLAANQKQALRASYEIKIAGKNELVGGNRRES